MLLAINLAMQKAVDTISHLRLRLIACCGGNDSSFLMYQITSKLSDALILRRGGTVKDWNYLKVYIVANFRIEKDSKTMSGVSWPRGNELNEVKEIVSAMAGRGPEEVKVVVSPYRICPLGAHIDHQGGTVSAMTINKGILLGFIPSDDTEVILRSGQFKGEVRFSVDEVQQPKPIRKKGEPHATDSPKLQETGNWGNFARGAVYALQSRGISLTRLAENHDILLEYEALSIAIFFPRGIKGYICGSEGLDSSGLSSSAAAGVAYLLAFETANNLTMTPTENIEYDRQALLIENEYLGLKNGILDQSAILLSSHGFLTHMNCKTKAHKLIPSPKLNGEQSDFQKSYKILLAFSGLKNALTNSPGYNLRVVECHEAAGILLNSVSCSPAPLEMTSWSLVYAMAIDPEAYETHKGLLEPSLAKRAEHYFSENTRVMKGTAPSTCFRLQAWASGNLKEFGKLISASGLSSIQNYECGCEPLKQLYEILLKAPGVYGVRFSGAGFRGCCLAFVDANLAEEAVTFVTEEYRKVQPKLASQIITEKAALICEAGDCAHVI
ncbi:hypothetical protein DKX38_009252 [Salix brachista]|uniref:Galactokinase N-terminal domain-containing protein n=1 Tax=Salix brachista TaxID=2182728 RepID=A0A5N5MCF3_9ROSI|nr:hypothetical protein DKX38_009252 [Salix brachista]